MASSRAAIFRSKLAIRASTGIRESRGRRWSVPQEDGEIALLKRLLYRREGLLVLSVEPSEPAGPQTPAQSLRSRNVREIEDDCLAESLICRHSNRIAAPGERLLTHVGQMR